MTTCDLQASDAETDKAQALLTEGRQALSNGDAGEAVRLLTESIQLDAGPARAFAFRARAYVKLQKPNAAIRDGKAALERNPDSAAAFKWIGRAEAMRGEWYVELNALASETDGKACHSFAGALLTKALLRS